MKKTRRVKLLKELKRGMNKTVKAYARSAREYERDYMKILFRAKSQVQDWERRTNEGVLLHTTFMSKN